jgi:hypothetical protein
MATKTATFSADGTIDLGIMIDPIFTVDGATWGSGTLKIKIEGVVMHAGYTADFYGELYDTCGRPMHFSATLSGSSSPDIDLTAVYVQERGRASRS